MERDVLTFRVKSDLLRRFKTECTRQGRTMSDVLREFMTAYAMAADGEGVDVDDDERTRG